MATRTRSLRVKKLYANNPFKRIRARWKRDTEDLPKAEAAFTRRRARSIMRKAPKRPKSRFGTLKFNKYGKPYWRKGLYSRPGHPPFHHGQQFNLRTIVFNPIPASSVHIKHPSLRGGRGIAYRVGPKYRKFQLQRPVPELHEFGGTVRVGRTNQFLEDRGVKFRRSTGRLHYPKRPYMAPAAKEARRSVRAKRGGSLKRLVNLAGLKGKRIY